jgi:hypothetical protein
METGMYRTAAGETFRVQISKQGHPYAMRQTAEGGWEYAPGAIKALRPSMRVQAPAPAAATQNANEAAEPEALKPGMYCLGEEIYKVQVSKTSGNPYAKRLERIGGDRLSETDQVVNWDFVYAPGAVRALTPAMRMTLAEAQAFGIRFGICCVCGAFLSDAKSVANGIGPVCARRNTWREAAPAATARPDHDAACERGVA